MIPLINVVVDLLVSVTYVLVDIYYFYCPHSRISTTQGRHRSGVARAEAPLRQAATPRNWLRGRSRVATGRAQPEPKHRFDRRRRPATGCGAGVSNNRCCRTKKFRSACRRTGQGKRRRTGQGKRRRTVPHARSASGKPVSPKKCSMKEKTITQPAVCRACTTTRQIVRS